MRRRWPTVSADAASAPYSAATLVPLARRSTGSTWLATRSERESAPASTRRSTATEVKGLVPLPKRNRSSARAGRLAWPGTVTLPAARLRVAPAPDQPRPKARPGWSAAIRLSSACKAGFRSLRLAGRPSSRKAAMRRRQHGACKPEKRTRRWQNLSQTHDRRVPKQNFPISVSRRARGTR